MYSLDILIGIGLCTLILGGLIGIYFGRRSTASSQQARTLEQRVDELNREKQAYENRVSAHFAETADRLNSLTDMYRGIHEHLAEGASTLIVGSNKETVTVKRLAGSADESDVPAESLTTEPPRDYAPRADGETGMLNESFGIERERLPGNRGPHDPDVDSGTAEDDSAANGDGSTAGEAADSAAAGEAAPKKNGA